MKTILKTQAAFLFVTTSCLLPTAFVTLSVVEGSAQSIAASGIHSVAVCTTGTVWTYGNNVQGQLGDNNPGTSQSSPVQVHGPGNVGFLTGITAVAAGDRYSLAVKNDSTVWTWGANGSGRLGDNTTTQRNTPVQVHGPGNVGFLTGITAVAGSVASTWALKNDGTVWAWGYNGGGQLGDNTFTNISTPVQVVGPGGIGFLTGITAIAAKGGENADQNRVWCLALKNDSTVWAWGYNGGSGKLGDGTVTDRMTPVQVLGSGGVGFLTGIITVAASGSNSFAIKNDGTLWAWGTGSITPSQVVGPGGVGFLTGIIAVAAGVNTSSESFSLALKNDGTVWAWGAASFGALGDGTGAERHTPVQSSPLCYVSPLPVELLSFTAECLSDKQKNNTVELKWSTASETNNDFFTVERTLNGFNWQLIGTVKGAGNSSTTQYYSLTDNEPLAGIAYYRLKQTDYDGKFEYFPLVASSCGKGIDIISIYPNPAIGDVNILVSSSELTGVTINLIDVLSRRVISQTAHAKQGDNTFTLDVSTLSSGSYMLQVVTESGLYRAQKQFVVK